MLVSVKCSGCGADLQSDALEGKVLCPHCGATETVGDAQPHHVGEVDLDALLAAEEEAPLPIPDALQVVTCSSCGAQTSHPPDARVMECPFCASIAIVEEQGKGRWFRPGGLLPFRITPEEAGESIRRWAAKLKLRPSRLRNMSRVDEIQGVYVPFWTVDCLARTGFQGTRVHVPHENAQPITDRVHGTRKAQYVDLLVCASKGLPVALVKQIEPFSTMTGLIPYQPKLLAGWYAEQSAVGIAEAWRRAEEHLKDCEYDKSVADARIKEDDRVQIDLQYKFEQRRGKPVLLPIYVAAYRYGGKSYRVLVNGETGEVSGQAPYSWVKLAMLALGFTGLTVLSAGTDLFFFLVVIFAWSAVNQWQARRQKRKAIGKAPCEKA